MKCLKFRGVKAPLFSLIVSSIIYFNSSLLANINGLDAHLFKPASDGIDFITVNSSQVLPLHHFNVGFFLNNAHNTFSQSAEGQYRSHDSTLTSDINGAYSLLDKLSFGFNLPSVWAHSTNNESSKLYFAKKGFTEIFLNAKYNLLTRTNSSPIGISLIPSVNFILLKDPYTLGNKRRPIFNIEGVIDYQLLDFTFALNLGYRIRNPSSGARSAAVSISDDQFIGSLGVSYFNEAINTGVTSELYLATQAKKPFQARQTPAEILVAGKYNFEHNLSTNLGFATKIANSFGNPDYRIFAGVNYYFGPIPSTASSTEQIQEKNQIETAMQDLSSTSPVILSFTSDGVLFNFDKYDLTENAKSILNELIKAVKDHPQIKSIEINGHTDSIGSLQYNEVLSLNRSTSVKKYLETNGLDQLQLKNQGFGVIKPIASNNSYAGRAKNRRVEFIIN